MRRGLSCEGCSAADVARIAAHVTETTGVEVVAIKCGSQGDIEVTLVTGAKVYLLPGQSAR